MIRKSLVCLPLAVGGAILTASAAAGAAPVTVPLIVGALLSGGASHLFNKLLDQSGDKVAGLFARRHPGIDENHHILMALRSAHLNALNEVLLRFDDARSRDLDPARSAEAARFSTELKRFLDEAKSTATCGEGPVSALEQAVFEGLPRAFDVALAARGTASPETSRLENDTVRRKIEADVLAELLVETATGGTEVPALFQIAFQGNGTDGWLELFVRDAAAQLKTNDAFRAIWSAEQLAHIRHQVGILLPMMEQIADDVSTLADVEAQRHREAMVKQDQILSMIAKEKGIDPDHLHPILERLGHTNATLDQIPDLLAASVDALLARSRDLAPIHNDGAAIDEAIRAAREKLQTADVEGALEDIDAALERDDAYERALQAVEDARAHRLQMGQARARGLFEKAFLHFTTYDHLAGIAALEQGLGLDPDNIWQWGRLGEAFETIGDTGTALKAFQAAGEVARRTGDERDLSVSYDRVGDVQVAQGDLTAALKSFQDGVAIAERLAASDAGNAGWQRDMIVSYVKISESVPTEAKLMLSKALNIAEKLRKNGRLAPADAWIPDALARRLAQL